MEKLRQPKNNPLVSIITVVKNGEQHIEQAIKSVLSQTYSNIEYIVIDGKSTDTTLKIVQRYREFINCIISEVDNGIYHAINKGIELANGEIIGILNSDDYYLSNTISMVVHEFKSTTGEIVFGNIERLKTIDNKDYLSPTRSDLLRIEETMSITHPACFVKKDVYQRVGIFNTQYRVSSDYDFIYRAYTLGVKFSYLDKTLTIFRVDGISNSSCRSYKEGLSILRNQKSPHVAKMRLSLIKCLFKTTIKKTIMFILRLFFLEHFIHAHQARKWSNK